MSIFKRKGKKIHYVSLTDESTMLTKNSKHVLQADENRMPVEMQVAISNTSTIYYH